MKKENRLIAEFMGAKVETKKNRYHYYDWKSGHKNIGSTPIDWEETPEKTLEYVYESLLNPLHGSWGRFHLYWDWLMPVIDKIESLGFDFQIESRNGALLRQNNNKASVISITKSYQTFEELKDRLDNKVKSESIIMYYDKPSEKLITTYKVAVKFIEWYNKEK